MPYISKPFVAVLSIFMSMALLSLAAYAVFPFLQFTLPGLEEAAAYTATGQGVRVGGSGDYKIIFSISINRIMGVKTYALNESRITILDPDGNIVPYEGLAGDDADAYWYFDFLPPVGPTTGLTLYVDWRKAESPDGYWTIILEIIDPMDGSTIQTLIVRILVL